MGYLIDTNVAIHIRNEDQQVVDRVDQLDRVPLISIMSLVELEAGVFRNPDLISVRRSVLDVMLGRVHVLDINRDIVTAYGVIVAKVGFSRARVIDRLIAATAIVNGLTLITMNGEDFRDIAGLALLAWPAPAQ